MNLVLIALALVSFIFSIFLLYPVLASYKARGKRITKLSGIIPESILNKESYALYFWAPVCGMCRGMTPIIDELIEQRDDLAKIDASQYPESARALGVLGTPALVLVRDGGIAKVSLGGKSEKVILKMLSSYLDSSN